MRMVCCICGDPITSLQECHPQFMTDPADPDLICKACLPAELVRQAKAHGRTLRLPTHLPEELN